ncbi:CPBP family intramembrane glutamic endopeptidase [Rhizobium rhizoryzae]|uniref:CPBP family intramembrane glutamic endopeptidase n=1 Tax=Rhizobium rhizoryzae TaxID=451876 RepID=UPI00289CD1CA|nr:type II CAAX endopeptidase family protein [Rhizobium rhizoryzae]
MQYLFPALKSIPRNMLTLLRMIFIDCTVPILFLFAMDFIAQIAKVLTAIILAGWSFETVVNHRIGYTVAMAAAKLPLLSICLSRRLAIVQSFRSARSIKIALAIGVCLLGVNLLAQLGVSDVGLEFSLSAILKIVATCVLAPVVEELFFRGYLWARLQARGYGEVSIIICTALLFAAIHLPDNFASLFNYLRMGFSFSLIRYFSGGIGLPIFFHAAMNFIVIRHIGV